jgi:hypothetical protein
MAENTLFFIFIKTLHPFYNVLSTGELIIFFIDFPENLK